MSWLSSRAVRRRRHLNRNVRPSVLQLESRVNPTSILQYHVDSQSDGVNNSETVLTPSNVNVNQFGKLYQIQVTGQVYAEPLVETGVNITVGSNQGMHDVVFVATEHDQLYAFDADYNPLTQTTGQQLLWQRSFLSDSLNTNPGDLLAGNTGVTSVPQAAVISSDITPEIGITGTPVIDPNTGTLYVSVKTAETVAGTVHYVQRFYAINIQNGTDQTTPFLLGDTTYNGTTYTNYASETAAANSPAENANASSQIWVYGTGNSGEPITDPYSMPASGKQIIQFNALREAVRSGMDLVNGVIYMAWASHGDNGPYHGWMVGISAYTAATPTMSLTGVLNTTPNGGLGGIWQAGGEVTYADGAFYFETGNGTFDGGNGTGTGGEPTAPAPGPITGINNAGYPISGDYADSFVKVVVQPFDPSNPTEPGGNALNQDITSKSTTAAVNPVTNQAITSNGWGLVVADYFTPFNQNYLNSQDLDVGSSAAVVVPDYNATIGGTNQLASAAEPMLLVGSGKEGVIYLLDRDGAHTGVNPDVPGYTGSMGGYGLSNHTVQPNNTTNELSGSLDSAAFFNNQMYYVQGYGGVAKSFTFVNGNFSQTPATQSPDSFAFAGSTPFISANNGTNGIVWDVDRGTNQLRAYNANSYGTELYTSAQAPNGRDSLGSAVKFQVTTVANGRVYVGSGTGDPNNFLDVYGELPPATGAPIAPSGLLAQPDNSTQIELSWTDNSVLPNTATSFTVQRSTNGGISWATIGTAFTTSYADTTVIPGTAYEYQVSAVDGFGSSSYSNTSTAKVPPQTNQTINFGSGFTTTGLTINGTAAVTSSRLRLTSGAANQAGSAFFTAQQGIESFSTTFTYALTGTSGSTGEGIAFVVQKSAATALGGNGTNIGYSGITPSFAVAISSDNGHLGTEFLVNGVVASNYTETNINTGSTSAPITVSISYAGSAVVATFTQGSNVDTKSYSVILPALLGSGTAFVGFTGGTGTLTATQDITSWTFTSGPHTIDYSTGFTTANTTAGTSAGGLSFNGATQATIVTGGVLKMTSNTGNQARAVYYTWPSDPSGHAGKQYVGSFSTTFTYNLSSANSLADGATFIIQNDSRGLTAIGSNGGGLAVGTNNGGTAVSPSIALAFNIYSGNALGTEIIKNGVVDENFTETNINTQTVNAPITVTIGYAAGIMTVTEQQIISGVLETDTKLLAVNIPALLGTDYAIVGFTGATGGNSATQNINSWTFDQGVVPQSPTGLSATVTGYTGGANGTVPVPVPLAGNLSWAAVTDTPTAGGTVSYKILRALSAAGPYTQIGTSATNSYIDTPLSTNTTYYYEVAATDTYGDSFPSTNTSATTPNLPPTATASQLTNVASNSISFQWQNNANNANGYLILRRVGGSGTFTILTTLPPNNNNVPNIMTYTDNTVSPGTAYDYHIQSYNLSGYSDFAGVSATTPEPAPTSLAANTGSGTIGLTWSAVSGAGITYNVYRGTSAGGESPTPIATGLTTASYTDSSLAFGNTYYYKVTTSFSGTESLPSNESSALADGPTQINLTPIPSPNPATPTQTVTLSATVTSGGGTPQSGSVKFFDNGISLGSFPVNSSGVAVYQGTFGLGTHPITANYLGSTGFDTSTTSQAVNEIIENAPTVASVQVNDGSVQRSEVRSITVTFSGPVTFSGGNAAAAFQLLHIQDSTNVALSVATSTNGSGQTVAVITFSGSETDPVSASNPQNLSPAPLLSLADGRYQLTINGSLVSDTNTGVQMDGAGTGTPGSNYISPADTLGGGAGQLGLYRAFGDATGNGVVDASDLGQFRASYNLGTGNANYLAYLDADNSGSVDSQDLGQFRSRYNYSVFN